MSGPAGLPRPRGIRFASAVFVAGLVVAGFIGGGSYWSWQVEKKDEVQSQRALQEMRARLDTIKRERDDLRGSEVTYKSLIERGAFAAEQRLDLIEAMTVLKKRHRLVSLEYDLFPQRPLKVTAASYAAADVRASRLRLKVHAYHDGELLLFLEEFARIQRGFFPIDKCTIKRTTDFEQRRQAAQAAAPVSPAAVPDPQAADAPDPLLGAAVEADCTMEWVTLAPKDEAGMPGSRPAGGGQTGARKP